MSKSLGIKVLSDIIWVEQDVETHKGCIVMPSASKLASGTVVAAGPGKKLNNGKVIPMEMAIGDRVVFGEHTGQKVEHDGKEYLAMRQEHVEGIIE